MRSSLLSPCTATRTAASLLPVLLVIAACSSEPSAPRVAPRFGKAPAGVSVSSTKPSYGDRGTTLDVHVYGSGFTSGATASWLLHGVADASKVRTNSTTYVSSTELVANITVSADADLAYWDVSVFAGGKNGVGTELFEITTAIDIGTLGGSTIGLDVNDAGQVVGGSYVGKAQHAFVWEPAALLPLTGTMRDLGEGLAYAIDETGTTIGGASGDLPVVWTKLATGTWSGPVRLPTAVGTLKPTSGAVRGLNMLVDGSGAQLAVGAITFTAPDRTTLRRATVWRRDPGGEWVGPDTLPDLGSPNGWAVGVGSNGLVVGGRGGGPLWEQVNGVWVASQVPAPSGYTVRIPYHVDPTGTVIVGSAGQSSAEVPVMWTRSGGTWSPTILPGVAGRAGAVSTAGAVIVGAGAFWRYDGATIHGPFFLPGIGNKSQVPDAQGASADGTWATGGWNPQSRGVLWRIF